MMKKVNSHNLRLFMFLSCTFLIILFFFISENYFVNFNNYYLYFYNFFDLESYECFKNLNPNKYPNISNIEKKFEVLHNGAILGEFNEASLELYFFAFQEDLLHIHSVSHLLYEVSARKLLVGPLFTDMSFLESLDDSSVIPFLLINHVYIPLSILTNSDLDNLNILCLFLYDKTFNEIYLEQVIFT